MIQSLGAEQLRKACDISQFEFDTTAALDSEVHIIGQPRGIRAIEFGVDVESPGYNIYVLGEAGTGRTTAIQRFIERQAEHNPRPDDWVYVYNFRESHKPRALRLAAGVGCSFREEMAGLIESLQVEIPSAFDNQAFRDAALDLQQEHGRSRDQLFAQLQVKASESGAALISSPEGVRMVLAKEGKPLHPQEFAALPAEEQAALQKVLQGLEHELNEALHVARLMERALEDKMADLIRRVGQSVVDVAIKELQARFSKNAPIVAYLDEAEKDILDNIALFRGPQEEAGQDAIYRDLQLRRYQINVVVDHLDSQHAPVVVEFNPTVSRLLGRVGHETYPGGAVLTDFSLIRAGALHAANGGYLVIRARDVFSEPGSWEALKRALIGGRISPDDPATRGGAATNALDPEQIPIDLKLLLIGPAQLYYALHEDEDFRTIFKVMADFAMDMERNGENELEYAHFVAQVCDKEGLHHFERAAVGMLIEYGGRLTGSQSKLSTGFGHIADVIREASHWCRLAGREWVSVDDVQQSIDERIFRRNRIEHLFREQIDMGKKLIDVSGSEVGQINGLSVSQVGEHAFGQPSRITASAYVGKAGVVQIDREVEMAGPIHNKGVLTLMGYLGRQYGANQPLSFSAMLTFEQNYGGVDGDSASSTELYSLLSSLSNYPVRQGVAVTGSVNQLGRIQPIGGVTQKVEGWYEVCKLRGLTGEQGAMIPASNVDDLMLRKEVVQAVETGDFHIWAVSTIDEGLEVMLGEAAADVHSKVQDRLATLSEAGRDSEN